jgi:ligand-binding sensor protein
MKMDEKETYHVQKMIDVVSVIEAMIPEGGGRTPNFIKFCEDIKRNAQQLRRSCQNALDRK